MHDVEDDPVMWLYELVVGLSVLLAVQVLTGCWTIGVVRAPLPSRLKLPVCVFGVCVLSILSYRIFDPKTHLVGSVVAAVSMSFTSPLQAAAWVRIKVAKPAEETSAYAVILRVALPAALPTTRHSPERPGTQLLRGSIYITLAVATRSLFGRFAGKEGFRLNLLGMWFIICIATGALNLTTSILGVLGARSPSPFRRPLLSPSLARFWSGRWNAPVSDALRVAVYDPLRRGYGCSRAVAVMACFFASAVAHELVLLYCGVRNSRGEWFVFFMLSGLATLLEEKLHQFVKNAVARYLFSVAAFYTLFHFWFIPVTVRTGFADEGIRALGAGPVLVEHLRERFL